MFLAMLLVFGCSPKVPELAKTIEVVQNISKQIDNHLSVNLTYKTEVQEYNQILVKKKSYSEETIRKVFFPDNSAKKRMWTDDLGFTLYDDNYEVRKDDYFFEYLCSDIFENYLTLVMKDNVMAPGVVRSDLKDYFIHDILSSLDYEVYKEINDDYITSLGIPLNLVEYYALDKDGLNQLEQKILPDEYYEDLKEMGSMTNERFRNWREEHEAYIFINQLKVDGIPVYNISYTPEGQIKNNDFGYAWSIIDKNGLVYLSIGSGIDEEIKREKIKMMDMSDALEQVITIYQNRIFTTSVCINAVQLLYIPIIETNTDIILVPAWKFQTVIGESDAEGASKEERNTIVVNEYTIVNGVTGEVLN